MVKNKKEFGLFDILVISIISSFVGLGFFYFGDSKLIGSFDLNLLFVMSVAGHTFGYLILLHIKLYKCKCKPTVK